MKKRNEFIGTVKKNRYKILFFLFFLVMISTLTLDYINSNEDLYNYLKNNVISLINLFPKLLTPAIAITTVYIAYQQYMVNKNKSELDKDKFRFDLFEKRYAVCKALISIVSDMWYEDNPTIPVTSKDEIETYYKKIEGYEFLFGKEIVDIIENINKLFEYYLHDYNLLSLLHNDNAIDYYKNKNYLPDCHPELENFIEKYDEISDDKKEEAIRNYIYNEISDNEYDNKISNYAFKIENHYKDFLIKVDRYINFKQIV